MSPITRVIELQAANLPTSGRIEQMRWIANAGRQGCHSKHLLAAQASLAGSPYTPMIYVSVIAFSTVVLFAVGMIWAQAGDYDDELEVCEEGGEGDERALLLSESPSEDGFFEEKIGAYHQ